MKEGDTLTFRTEARRSVDETHTGLAAPLEGAVEIVNGKTDVVDARSALGDELADGSASGVGLQQLDERFPGLHAGDARTIRVVERHFGHPEDVSVEGKDLVEGFHRDAHVGDASGAAWKIGHVGWLEGLRR